MQEERLWLLVSLKFAGEATSAELEELAALLKEHPEAYFQMELLEKYWNTDPPAEKNTDLSYNKHLQRLSNYLSEPPLQYEKADPVPKSYHNRRISIKLFWATGIAALLLLSFLFIYYINSGKKLQPIAQNSVSTKPGSKSKLQLPDGSEVWLNVDSRITYNENFAGNIREVYLDGEAYFDVVKDKTRPFVIHTKSVDIKVLGTAFNVRSYADETNTETALIRGSVEITVLNDPGKKIILKPSEKLVVQNAGATQEAEPAKAKEEKPLLSITKVHYLVNDSTSVETSWIKNKLAFEAETLEQVAMKLERWYDIHIVITDDQLKDVKYTGLFEEESVTEVMNALKLTGNFNYTIDRKEIEIRP